MTLVDVLSAVASMDVPVLTTREAAARLRDQLSTVHQLQEKQRAATAEQLTSLLPNLKVELIPPVVIQGLPQEADYEALDEMADAVVAKHKEAKLM